MTDPAGLRRSYARGHLDEDAVADTWLGQLRPWFDAAVADPDVLEANAIQLATADGAGDPSVRTVLVKSLDERGIVFYTNYDSAKGRDLAANPRAAAVFVWPAQERQVRLRGTVSKVARTETEAYFAGRPRESQVGAWASAQSQVVASRAALDDAFEAASARFGDGPIPPPPHWGGYLLAPESVEFWQGTRWPAARPHPVPPRRDRVDPRAAGTVTGPPRKGMTTPSARRGPGEGVTHDADPDTADPDLADPDLADEDAPELTDATPDATEAPDQARTLGRLLRRQAVDTRPLKIPAYRRLLIGQGTSFIGSMLTQVAVPVQVYAISHSSLYVGFVGLAGLVPIVVFGLYGGAIADSMDRRTLYFWSSLGTWVVTLALLVQTLFTVGSVWLILGLVVVQSGFFATASSARGAIIPRIVETDLVPAANTLNFTVGNIGQVVGPLIAGVLVALPHGFAFAYGIDGVVFTAALYSALRLPSIPPDGSGRKLGLRSVVEGLAFIATRPVLMMSFAVDIAAMVFAMPRALFPAVADARFGGDVGPLYAAIAIGAVVAGASSGWIGRVRRQGVALTVAVIGWGGAVALSGLAHQLWLVVLLLAVAGAADLVSAVYRQTILQTYAPDEMRGRMQGVFIAVVAGGPRLGDVRAGGVAAATGPTFSWVGGGIACMAVVAVAGVLVRPFWRYDASVVEPAEMPAEAVTPTAS